MKTFMLLQSITTVFLSGVASASSLNQGQTYYQNGLTLRVTSIMSERESCGPIIARGDDKYYSNNNWVYDFTSDKIALQCRSKKAYISGLKATKLTLTMITAGCAASAAFGGPVSLKAAAVFGIGVAATELVEFVVDHVPCTTNSTDPAIRKAQVSATAGKAICDLAKRHGADCEMYE